jgi:hypothetical protein
MVTSKEDFSTHLDDMLPSEEFPISYDEEPCCWCNDEGATDDESGEVHPCAFCGAC